MANEKDLDKDENITTDEAAENAVEAEEVKEEATEAAEGTSEETTEEAATDAPKKDKKDEQIEALKDQYLRKVAEFENYRTRTEKEKAQMYDFGARDMVEKILPVVDNFERGLANVKEGDDAFSDGMLMIYKQLQKGLADAGVTPIEALGKEFDPNLHNAVMQVESEEYESGIIAQELQKGYMYKETVVRHSMVGVAQ